MPDKATPAEAQQVESDLNALKEAGYDISDAGRGNKAMTEADVARETGSTSKQASEAAHAQRDDSDARH